jgi:hypothetical protein
MKKSGANIVGRDKNTATKSYEMKKTGANIEGQNARKFVKNI